MKLHLSLILAALLAGAALPACETFGSSKVAQGQLYVSGDGRYDPFFEEVHKQQIEATSWGDDRKAARKAITTAVNVTPNASENTILDAIRSRSSTRAEAEKLAPAIEETKKADAERAQKLRAALEKLEALAKEGHEFSDGARRDYENRGADKADEEKSARMRDVRKELGAATDICESLARDARKWARDSEFFADDMQRAMEGKGPGEHKGEPPRVEAKKADDAKKDDDGKKGSGGGDAKKPDDAKKGGDAKKPDDAKKGGGGGDKGAPKPEATKPKPAAKPADKPAEKPAEKPAQKPADEVFNP